MAKCDYICISREELAALEKGCRSSASKKGTAKPRKAPARPRKAVKGKARKSATAKASLTVRKKKKSVNKNKNVNTNNNMVTVDVRANPRAVSNVYIIRQEPAQRAVETAPAKRKRIHIPYDAPYLPRRAYDGQVMPVVQSSRPARTVYIERGPAPEIVVESEKAIERTGTSKRGLLSGIGSGRAKAISEPKQEVLPPETKALPPGTKALPSGTREIALEDCGRYSDEGERRSCKERNRRKVST